MILISNTPLYEGYLFVCGVLGQFIPAQLAVLGFVDAPVFAAGDTLILGLSYLYTGRFAMWAGATRMEPVAVGIHVVVDGVAVYDDREFRPELHAGDLPCVALHGDQVDVAVVRFVAERRVAEFMKQPGFE